MMLEIRGEWFVCFELIGTQQSNSNDYLLEPEYAEEHL